MEEKTKAEAQPLEAPTRKPYRAPALRKLGSIRELTLGGTRGSRKDGIVGKKV